LRLKSMVQAWPKASLLRGQRRPLELPEIASPKAETDTAEAHISQLLFGLGSSVNSLA
jgi:hypothetical protein